MNILWGFIVFIIIVILVTFFKTADSTIEKRLEYLEPDDVVKITYKTVLDVANTYRSNLQKYNYDEQLAIYKTGLEYVKGDEDSTKKHLRNNLEGICIYKIWEENKNIIRDSQKVNILIQFFDNIRFCFIEKYNDIPFASRKDMMMNYVLYGLSDSLKTKPQLFLSGLCIGSNERKFVSRQYMNWVIVWGYRGKDKYITIPETIGGLPVRAVEGNSYDRTLWYYQSYISVPKTVKSINILQDNIGRFIIDKDNPYLKQINGHVIDIKSNTLIIGCRLRPIPRYGVNSIGRHAFTNESTMKKLIIPSTIKSIYDEAFANSYNIEILIIEDGVKSIGYESFKNCKELRIVYVPKSINDISFYCFLGCPNLEKMYIDSEDDEVRWRSLLGYSSKTEIVKIDSLEQFPFIRD